MTGDKITTYEELAQVLAKAGNDLVEVAKVIARARIVRTENTVHVDMHVDPENGRIVVNGVKDIACKYVIAPSLSKEG